MLSNLSLPPFQDLSWQQLAMLAAATPRPLRLLLRQGTSALSNMAACPVKAAAAVAAPASESMLPEATFMKVTLDICRKMSMPANRRWAELPAWQAYVCCTSAELAAAAAARVRLSAFVRETTAMCEVYEVWSGGFVMWQQVPWRRSAIEYASVVYPELLLGSEKSPPAFAQGDLELLEESMQSVVAEAMELFVKPLPGLSKTHWWWWVIPGPPGHH
ncbi:unnamed protein product [Phaeothamnion confervicola]